MSYCAIITFENGKPAKATEYRNAWGGAAYIWDCLFNKYLKDPKSEYDSWVLGRNRDKLWKLAGREDLPMWMRAVHAATFDRAVIAKEHLLRFAADLRAFVEHFGTGDRVCHLTSWARFCDEHADTEAIGFYHTSVGDNLWYEWDEEAEESTPYDLNAMDRHFEVYYWLDTATPRAEGEE